MSITVVVYILQDGIEDRRAEMKTFFKETEDLKYKIILPEIHYQSKHNSIHPKEAHKEAYHVGWCLLDAKENYPDQNIIILKDTCLCNASQETLQTILQKYIEQSSEFHLGYLCRWEDKCHFHSDKKPITGGYIAKTVSPNGLQALMVTPEGREILVGAKPMKNGHFFKPETSLNDHLNREIYNGNIEAICVVPNLFSYDIRQAQSNEDFVKVNECESVPSGLYSKGSSINQYIILLIIIILLIFIIWAAIKVSP